MAGIEEVVKIWNEYLKSIPYWELLIKGVEPKEDGCGFVYGLDNPLSRPQESFAIADMRELVESEPHKHINGETEIYFVLQGTGKVAVGQDIHELRPGISIVTPPDTVHGVMADNDLVLAIGKHTTI